MITTKKGDNFYTDIKNKRVKKDSQVIELLGCFDETCAIVMLADNYAHLTYITETITFLSRLAGVVSGYSEDFDTSEFIQKLESFIFSHQEKFSFSFPIRQENKIYLNFARTKIRELERKCCTFGIKNNYAIAINRLSDYIYVEQIKCK